MGDLFAVLIVVILWAVATGFGYWLGGRLDP